MCGLCGRDLWTWRNPCRVCARLYCFTPCLQEVRLLGTSSNPRRRIYQTILALSPAKLILEHFFEVQSCVYQLGHTVGA